MHAIKDTKELGKIIRETRRKQNLTQEQLAATCGVGMRFIRELEQGKESCHIGKAMMLLHMLGIQIIIDEEGI